MEANRLVSSKPKRILPTKPEREALNWLKEHASHLDIGCKINDVPIHLNRNAAIEQHYFDLRANMNAELPCDKRVYLPTKITTRLLKDHSTGEKTYYFVGTEKPRQQSLIMIDVDCHRSGNLAGAMAFVSYLRAHHFANLYYEPSTNGNGAHAYLLLEKETLSVPACKHVLLKKLQPWLNQLAKDFDVEFVEIKGMPPELTWGRGQYDLRSYKSGTLAKIPRGIFNRFAELKNTTVVSILTLADLPDVAQPIEQKSKKPNQGSFSGKHIDVSQMPAYRRLAKHLLQGEVITTPNRHIATEEDVAIFLLLGEWWSINDAASRPCLWSANVPAAWRS